MRSLCCMTQERVTTMVIRPVGREMSHRSKCFDVCCKTYKEVVYSHFCKKVLKYGESRGVQAAFDEICEVNLNTCETVSGFKL